MASEGRTLSTIDHVPQMDGSVKSCRGESLTVHGERQTVSPIRKAGAVMLAVHMESSAFLPGSQIPQLHSITIASRGQRCAIGCDRQAIDAFEVRQRGKFVTGCHVPESYRIVFKPARDQRLPIRRECNTLNAFRMSLDRT